MLHDSSEWSSWQRLHPFAFGFPRLLLAAEEKGTGYLSKSSIGGLIDNGEDAVQPVSFFCSLGALASPLLGG